MAAAVAPLDARAMADFERTGFAVVTLPLTAEYGCAQYGRAHGNFRRNIPKGSKN
eukprot:COSAG03_NODE_22028_length_296_cov_0.786802_1_plen_54_part_01